MYDNCEDYERVKYGVINYTNDAYGVYLCEGYGKAIMVLNESVRKRCTICHKRTYGNGEIVGTLKYHNPVLA